MSILLRNYIIPHNILKFNSFRNPTYRYVTPYSKTIKNNVARIVWCVMHVSYFREMSPRWLPLQTKQSKQKLLLDTLHFFTTCRFCFRIWRYSEEVFRNLTALRMLRNWEYTQATNTIYQLFSAPRCGSNQCMYSTDVRSSGMSTCQRYVSIKTSIRPPKKVQFLNRAKFVITRIRIGPTKANKSHILPLGNPVHTSTAPSKWHLTAWSCIAQCYGKIGMNTIHLTHRRFWGDS